MRFYFGYGYGYGLPFEYDVGIGAPDLFAHKLHRFILCMARLIAHEDSRPS